MAISYTEAKARRHESVGQKVMRKDEGGRNILVLNPDQKLDDPEKLKMKQITTHSYPVPQPPIQQTPQPV